MKYKMEQKTHTNGKSKWLLEMGNKIDMAQPSQPEKTITENVE